MKISNAEEAVEQLKESVEAIVSMHDAKLREDITQACWLAIFRRIEDGCHDKTKLLCRARYAATDEYRELTGNGFRPIESSVKPPGRVFTNWIGNCGRKETDEESPEPTYELEDPSELDDYYIALLKRCENETETKCINAAWTVAKMASADLDFKPTVTRMASEAGLSAWRFKNTMISFYNRVGTRHDQDQD